MPANGPHEAASAVVFIVGLHQGLIPLVAGLVFDREPTLALATRLPTPWWWLACLAVVGLATALLAAIDQSRTRTEAGAHESTAPGSTAPDTTEEHG
jgi:hypothetical protein